MQVVWFELALAPKAPRAVEEELHGAAMGLPREAA